MRLNIGNTRGTIDNIALQNTARSPHAHIRLVMALRDDGIDPVSLLMRRLSSLQSTKVNGDSSSTAVRQRSSHTSSTQARTANLSVSRWKMGYCLTADLRQGTSACGRVQATE